MPINSSFLKSLTLSNTSRNFYRLKEVLYSEKHLYLVFEYLEFDLKKYLKSKTT
jgi:hypothetical protein